MVRVTVLALVAIFPAIGQRIGVYVADTTTTPTDPIGLLTSLGVGGLVALPVYLWQRDTAKSRDKAQDTVVDLTAAIGGLQKAIEQSTEAQKAGTVAVNEMSRWLRER